MLSPYSPGICAAYLSAYSGWVSWMNERCRCDGLPCRACQRRVLWTESICLEIDLAVAEHVSGRRTDGATTARREGLGWA